VRLTRSLLAGGLLGVLLAGCGGSTTLAPPTVAPAAPSEPVFPAPPSGAVVFAREDGLDALGLAVVPGRGKAGLEASIVGRQGSGVERLAVRFQVVGVDGRSSTAAATACGPGCYRAAVAVARPTSVAVIIGRRSPRRLVFVLPAQWPPPPAGALVTRAARVWRSLRSLVDHDTLSDGHYTGLTVWKIVAPDRLEYLTSGDGDSVIIGDHRWDKPSGPGPWTESSQLPVRQPVPDWVGAVDIRLLGTVSIRGKPAWRISFFDPGTPGWFTILVDKETLHTVDVRMIATDHFMHDVYGPFNAPIRITPPR